MYKGRNWPDILWEEREGEGYIPAKTEKREVGICPKVRKE